MSHIVLAAFSVAIVGAIIGTVALPMRFAHCITVWWCSTGGDTPCMKPTTPSCYGGKSSELRSHLPLQNPTESRRPAERAVQTCTVDNDSAWSSACAPHTRNHSRDTELALSPSARRAPPPICGHA